ncbi:hypothetical protein [Candidatus Uabimicrobium sp. HlEnr_7]|uniref:hypothetical protein n=1 Tax=Candidatus Uabimicrobium helgolandensis TaxID=3095367 RepID=UPI00355745BC
MKELDVFCIPAILLDALWRFGIVHKDKDDIPVPEMGGSMFVAPITDRELPKLQLQGSNPTVKNKSLLYIVRIELMNSTSSGIRKNKEIQ